MKFKLVESIDDVLIEEVLEEEKLDEKYWIKLEAPGVDPFYYYVINNTYKGVNTDLDTLEAIIAGTNTGTFKQQLAKEILAELKASYKNCLKSKSKFSFNILGHNISDKELKDNRDRILTLTDRDLRNNAHLDLGKGIKNSFDYLIHHKNEHEDDNDYSNLVLIERSAGDEYAHAIHKIIQKRGSSLASATVRIPLKQWDGSKWVVTNIAEITIV